MLELSLTFINYYLKLWEILIGITDQAAVEALVAVAEVLVAEVATEKDRLCTKLFALTVVMTAKCHLDQLATNLSIVVIVLVNTKIQVQIVQVADLAVATEALVVAVTEVLAVINRCLMQFAINAVNLAKYHLDQVVINQFIAMLVLAKAVTPALKAPTNLKANLKI